MDEIGSILREARELKGLTLNEVHETLRISVKFLKALENGQYSQLPSATHVRGYLSKYARFLGLDPAPLLDRYEQVKDSQPVIATAAAPQPTIPILPEPETGTFFEAYDLDVGPPATDSSNGSDWIGRLIILALIVSIALISWRFVPLLLNQNDTEAEVLATSAATQEALNELNSTGSLSPTITLTNTSGFEGLPTERTSPESTTIDNSAPPAPTRSPLPATLESIEFKLDITERSWVRVVVDDLTVYEGQMRKGDSFNWTAADYVTLRTGNAAGVYITINGIDLGRLGGRSQVIEETWQTTQ